MTATEIELQALICEREGMVAANMQCQTVGNSMAYGEVEFFKLADKMRALKS